MLCGKLPLLVYWKLSIMTVPLTSNKALEVNLKRWNYTRNQQYFSHKHPLKFWDGIGVTLLCSVICPEKTCATAFIANQIHTLTNHNLVTHVFLCTRQFACFYFVFPLVLWGVFLSSDWSFWLLYFWFLWHSIWKSYLLKFPLACCCFCR